MIFDVIIFIVILLFIVLGVWRGAARTLLNLVAMTANAVISHFLSAVAAQAVYDSFIKSTVISNIERFITQSGEQYTAQNSIQALPDSVRGLIGFFTGFFGASPENLQGRMVPSTAQSQQAAHAIEKPLEDLTVCILSILLMIVIFIALSFLFKLFIRMVLGVFEFPFIRQINKLLGGVLGAVEGVVFACVAVNVLYLLMSYANPVLAENNTVFGGVFNALILLK